MKALTAIIAAVGMLAAGAASADQALFNSKGCVACHNADKQVVGPALKAIAKKYNNDAGKADALATSIVKGSQGKYPEVKGQAMPPNATVKPDDAKKLATWILGLK